MNIEEKCSLLLQSNIPEDNILAISLLQSQLNWSLKKALEWSFKVFLQKLKTSDQEESLYFDNIQLIIKFEELSPQEKINVGMTEQYTRYLIFKDNQCIHSIEGNYLLELEVAPKPLNLIPCLDRIYKELVELIIPTLMKLIL